ncbi:3'-5' exonuclease [Delftia acidovorans]
MSNALTTQTGGQLRAATKFNLSPQNFEQALTFSTRAVLSSIDVIVKPNGWTIPDDVTKIHGITTEKALDLGVPEDVVVSMLLSMWGGRMRVAHNESFDARILRIGIKRYIYAREPATALPQSDIWKAGPSARTALLTTSICQLPPTEKMRAVGMGKFKTPKLTEAYHHFYGRDFEGAHTAGADVASCIAVYFAV